LVAIVNKNKKGIKFLYNEKLKIILKMIWFLKCTIQIKFGTITIYSSNCTAYLKISSSLINQLMKNNNRKLLEILF